MSEMTQLLLPEVRDVLHGTDAKAIAEAVEALTQELLAADIADLLLKLDHDDAVALFRALIPRKRIHAFEFLNVEEQEKLVQALGPETLGAVLDGMSSDDRADLFRHLPPGSRDRLYPMLAQAERNDVKRLLEFKEGTVGSVMSTEYAVIGAQMTAAEAIDHLRHVAPQRETIYIVYVVDTDRRLKGVASLRELIIAPAAAKVADIMRRELITANVNDERGRAAELITKYDFLALPIVDDDGRLLGIVTYDDVIDLIEAEATQDAQKLGGMEALDMPYLSTPLLTMFKKRGGWLAVLFIGEMLTASAMGYFEGAIEKAVVLALFIPLIISSGGNSGSQAASLVIRALATREVTVVDWWRVMRREVASGLMLGVLLGALGFVRIAVWANAGFMGADGEHWVLLGLTIFASLIGVVMWGTLTGSLLPILMKRIGADPATSSTPFVATLVDVTGIVIYFAIATLVLHGTLL